MSKQVNPRVATWNTILGVPTTHKSTKLTITLAETFGLIVIALLILALTLIRFARSLPWHVQ